MLSKKNIKKKARSVSIFFPYATRREFIKYTNRDYFNWLSGYVFQHKCETIAKLRKHQCLFVHIPKCAGNSINNGLLKVNPGMGHLTAFDYSIALTKKEFDRLFKFSFVRNPWDRLVSAYFYMFQGGWSKEDRFWFDKHLGSFKSFEDFVINWVTPQNIRRHVIFYPQIEFISIADRCQMDFLGRCEQIDKDIDYVAKQTGLDYKIRNDNTTKKRPDYQQIYTSKTKDIVFQVYHDDIKQLGYEF